MARPQKQGMDYFPMDVSAGRSVEYIRLRYGLTGFGVIVRLWQSIYAESYYIRFDQDAQAFFAADNRIEEKQLKEIVRYAVAYGVFDEGLYKKYGILTSRDIQERYFSAIGRRSRVEAERRFLLLPPAECGPNLCLDGVFVNRNQAETDVSVDNNPQKKEKETKPNQNQNQNKLNININQTTPQETTQKEIETKDSGRQSKEAMRLAGLFSQLTGKKAENRLLEGFLEALGSGLEPKKLEQLVYKAAKQQQANEFLEGELVKYQKSP